MMSYGATAALRTSVSSNVYRGRILDTWGRPMFNPTQIVIEAFVSELQVMYERTYGVLEPSYPGIIGFVGRLALENIANSDAAYHDMNHTVMVTLVGQEILRGRHISEGGVHAARLVAFHRITSMPRYWVCSRHLPRRRQRSLRD
jgi:hypothetical protein